MSRVPTVHIMPNGVEGRTLCADRSLVSDIAKGLKPFTWPIDHGQVSPKPGVALGDVAELATCADCRALAGREALDPKDRPS